MLLELQICIERAIKKVVEVELMGNQSHWKAFQKMVIA